MNESNWFRVCMVYMFCSAKLLRFYQCMQAREVIWCCIQSLWLKRVAKSLALASQLSASSVGFQSHQCCLSFLYSYSQIKALTIQNYEVLCGCFEKDHRFHIILRKFIPPKWRMLPTLSKETKSPTKIKI